ncbi:hypothetical protein H9X57_18270 [Flavobacterium piscinae]|uniref:hypothetical protein n=1 Tax=Flavobacterium piscinae TaxID=2506424 RepID=UPI00198BC500|nr:hypothetical protein [Flavobacterium piscinae]MBC8884621.1 hypothetical protein [Flavobacterium piscinae]
MNDSKYKNSGFKGLFKGTLTIASSPNNNTIIYEKNQIEKAKPSTIQIMKDATDPKKILKWLKGLTLRKICSWSKCKAVSAPSVIAGEAGIVSSLGLLSDIDQLTGATENLIESNSPEMGTYINGIKLTISLISLKGNLDALKNLGKIDCNIDASSKLTDTIIGTAGTASDAQDFNKSID